MGKSLPHDVSAERTVLGTAMIYPDSIHTLSAHLGEDDFYVPAHQAVFRTLVKLAVSGEFGERTLDITMMELSLRGDGSYGIVGPEKLSEIGAAGHHPAVLMPFVQRVREIGNARRLLLKIREVSEQLADLNRDPKAWVENARTVIEDNAELRRKTKAKTINEMCHDEAASWKAKNEGASMGISYGLHCIDNRTLGLMPPEYVIICARPSIGKSAIMAQIALSMSGSSWQGMPVHVRIDLFEGTTARLTERILSQQSRLDYKRVRQGRFADGEMERALSAFVKISQHRLVVDDEECNEQELFLRWREWRHDIGIENPAVAFGDYLQICDTTKPDLPREQQVTMISRMARRASKRLNMGIIWLCQLNRQVDLRGKKSQPQLSDLRESGSIEQDAATVIAIHRPGAVAESDEERRKHKANGKDKDDDGGGQHHDPSYTEILLLKARDGEVGVDKVSFTGRCLRFEEITQRPEPLSFRNPQPD